MLVRWMIGYVPQLRSAVGNLTGQENVQLFDVPRAERGARVAQALTAMGLSIEEPLRTPPANDVVVTTR